MQLSKFQLTRLWHLSSRTSALSSVQGYAKFPVRRPLPLPGRALPLIFGLCMIAHGVTARAANIVEGDVTSVLGPSFFVDDAALGGTDTDINHGSVASFVRLFNGLLTPNQGPARIVLTGFGFATHISDTANDATSVAVTFTYLGANEAIGGGDDVSIGTATGAFTFSGGKEYVFAFDAPLIADLNITGTRFRIQVAPINANHTTAPDVALKLKTAPLASEPSVTGAKLSVAGVVSPVINPQRVNLAKFQPVTASAAVGQRLASYLTDGVAGNDNRWQGETWQWNTARVDFPFPVEVGSAQVFTGVDDTLPVGNFSIQYLDGGTWVTIPGASVSGNTNVERNLVFTNSITATSFRLLGQDGSLRIRELALYPPNGPGGFPLGADVNLNLAYQRPCIASANTAGNFALKAVDGRSHIGSMWQTNTAGTNTLEIDLRVGTKIGSVHLYSGSTGLLPLANFVLKYWNGTTWLDIPGATVAGNTTADLIVPFSTPVTTSKVRLEFTNSGTTAIRELCVFPANTGNVGYPIGTNIIESGAVGNYDTFHDAFYQISNPSSGRFVAVAGGGQPILDVAGLTNARSRYQVLLNLSNGTYRLRNSATGNCLSGARLSKNPGEPLIDAPYAALPHQDWILNALGGGAFQLVNQWSGLVLDTQSGSTASGTPLVQNVPTGAASQRWQFASAGKYPKKGIGGASAATIFNANWAYNWGLTSSVSQPPGAVFHPMQWGDFNWNFDTTAASTWKLYPAWRAAGQSLHLLGFNEPDKFDQSGRSLDPTNPPTEADFSSQRSMEEAVLMWPRLQAMDQPLVSPVPANMNGGWLAGFYSNVNALGYRVDYTALHTYPGPSGGSSDDLINTLQTGYNNWGRPVWLTEFSFVNWSGTGTWTEEDNYNCLAEFLWRAESIPWLRKYALFSFHEAGTGSNNPASAAPAQPWSPVGPRSNSIDINGNLTAFGRLYAAWDNDAAFRTGKTYHIHHKSTRKRLANVTTQSNAAARTIRTDGDLVHWTLVAAPVSNQYHIVSSLDGRRLSSDGTIVSLVAAGTTGTDVQWSLAESAHGWFYLGHPASSKRLKFAYNNTTAVATYSMVANTSTGDDVQWRFIAPLPPPSWTGAGGDSWTTAGNWNPGAVPATNSAVAFNSSSTANLNTLLNQDFSLLGVTITEPAGPVSIGGSNILTLGAGGIDLSGASQNLTITAPLVVGAPHSWTVGSGRNLTLDGVISSPFDITIAGAGRVSFGASGLLPSGAGTGNLVVNGTLDLNGTDQSINGLSGSGIVDNTGGAGVLTIGNNDAVITHSGTFQNTGGTLTLIKTGSGSLTLNTANTLSGGTTLNGGTVFPKNNDSFGSGSVSANAGTSIYATGGTYNFANVLTLNGGTLRVGGGVGRSVNWTGPVSVSANSEIRADGDTSGITISNAVAISGVTLSSFAGGGSLGNTISAPISGSGTLTVTSGLLALNAANTFGGTFRAALGTLRAGDPLAMQNGTLDMNAVDSGTVNLNNLSATIGALTGSRNLALGSGVISIGNNHASTSYSGVLSGSGSLVKTGSGTLTLSGTNSYAGGTAISSGTLALGASNVLPGTALNIGNAVFNVATHQDTVGALGVTGTAAIHLGEGAALAFTNSSAMNWTGGTLNLTGTFVPGVSIRFGTSSGGLTSTQLGLIEVNGGGGPFILNSTGFLTVAVTNPYDAWKAQITNGLNLRADDADGDGFTNLHEFLFGTSPISSNGSLVSTTSNSGNLVLRWLQRESGASYSLKQSATLAAGSWVPAAQSPILDPDQSDAPAGYDYHTATLPGGGGSQFFRVDGVEN